MLDDIKNIVLHIDGGIGKNIAATGLVSEIKSLYPDKDIIVVTAWDEAWMANPKCRRVYNFRNISYFYEDFILNKPTYVIKNDPYSYNDYIMRKKSLVEAWSAMAGFSGNFTSPELYMTERELEFTRNSLGFSKDQRPIFVIHPNGGGDNNSLPYSWARDIPPAMAQEIANRMNRLGYRVIQLGRQNQRVLDGVELVSSSIRIALCVLALSSKRLLIDSFSQHAAAALNQKSTVLWIANRPSMIGYDFHDNIICQKEMRPDATRNSYLEPFNILGDLGEYPFPDGPLFDIEEIMNSILK